MSGTKVTLSAIGQSAWIPVSWQQRGFGVSLGVIPSSNATLTYNVQHTFDNTQVSPVGISQTTTTVTVTSTNHGMSVADSVQVLGSGVNGMDGTFQVATVVDQNNYTYTSLVSVSATASPQVQIIQRRVHPHAILTGGAARADGNYAFAPRAVRLMLSAYTSGYVDLWVVQGSDA